MRQLDAWLKEVFEAACVDTASMGFRVVGTSCRRRHGATQQEIHAFLDRRSQVDFGRFAVAIDVSFEELRLAMSGQQDPTWRPRLDRLDPAWPVWRELRASTDRVALAAERARPCVPCLIDSRR